MKESSIRIVKCTYIILMSIAFICALGIYRSASVRQDSGALLRSFLPYSVNFLLLIAGLISFVAALICFSLYTNADPTAQAAMVNAAGMRYDHERKLYNAETYQSPDYTPEKSDLVTQGNHYLKLWTLYTACVAIAFLLIWSQTMTQNPAALYTIAGLIVALLPAIYLEIHFGRIARMVAGYPGTQRISLFALLSTTRTGRGAGGPFLVALTILFLFGIAILAVMSAYQIAVYYLFTTYLPVLILAVLATLGITYGLLRLRENNTPRSEQ